MAAIKTFLRPLVLLPWLFALIPLADAAPAADRERQLDNLLLQDCGSCHGPRMTGGLGQH